MSYDLVAFDGSKVGNTKEAVLAWYQEETKWKKELDYMDERNLSSNSMKAFFDELITVFPPMNGRMAPSDAQLDENPELEDYLSDYSISDTIIYGAFAWSKAEQAYEVFKTLAEKYNVGFYNCSDGEEISFNIMENN